MLLSKWVVAGLEDFPEIENLGLKPGFCLDLRCAASCMHGLYQFANEMAVPGTFTIFLSEKSFGAPDAGSDADLDALIMLFFQPGFYLIDNSPVIFVERIDEGGLAGIIKNLKMKCISQGFKGLTVACPVNADTHADFGAAICYYVKDKNPDLGAIVNNWIKTYLHAQNIFPIHFIMSGETISGKLQCFKNFLQQELLFSQTMEYAMANRIYMLQEEIADFREQKGHEKVNADNLQLYLDIQKKDLAKALDWYHYEYEILPLWYKRFGHIIKVLTGKRYFRSLFNDHVKKYKS